MIKKILVVLLSSVFLAGCNRIDNHQPLTTAFVDLNPGSTISQSFTSSRDNMNIVSICLRSGHFLEPLEFRLYESTTSGNPVRTLPFDAANIDGFDCTKFQFEPVDDSKGKEYIAEVKRPTKPEEFISKPPLIRSEAHARDDYEKGTAYKGETPQELDLHFKTHYKQPLGDITNEVVSNLARRIPQDLIFFIPYALALIGLIIYYTRLK